MSNLPTTIFVTILKSNPGHSYTLYSDKAELFGYENGIIEVTESEMLRKKLDLYEYKDNDFCLLFYSPISKTFSTIYDYTLKKSLPIGA